MALRELDDLVEKLGQKAREMVAAMREAEPGFLDSMVPRRPGASEWELTEIEQALGGRLPDTLRDVLSRVRALCFDGRWSNVVRQQGPSVRPATKRFGEPRAADSGAGHPGPDRMCHGRGRAQRRAGDGHGCCRIRGVLARPDTRPRLARRTSSTRRIAPRRLSRRSWPSFDSAGVSAATCPGPALPGTWTCPARPCSSETAPDLAVLGSPQHGKRKQGAPGPREGAAR